MKQINIISLKKKFIILSFLMALLLCSCQKNSPNPPVSPFSNALWNDTLEDIKAYEGDEYTTYDSIYGGICYSYPKMYQNRQGTVKYMFDDEERLMCIAWTCSSDEEEELYSLYGVIEESINEQTGTEPHTTDKTSNTGHVWYREDGNIILSLMITSNLKAFQYSYLHPEVSNHPKE